MKLHTKNMKIKKRSATMTNTSSSDKLMINLNLSVKKKTLLNAVCGAVLVGLVWFSLVYSSGDLNDIFGAVSGLHLLAQWELLLGCA